MSLPTRAMALPAILFNPIMLLHAINTLCSYVVASNPLPTSSPHPIIEQLGPKPGTEPYFDMHKDDAMCWRYTAIMILIQLFAYGRVLDYGHDHASVKQSEVETAPKLARPVPAMRRSRSRLHRQRTTDSHDEREGQGILLPAALIANGVREAGKSLPVR